MKGFIVTANYQDVTPEMIRAVAAYVDEQFGSYSGYKEQAAVQTLDYLAKDLEEAWTRNAETAELESLGGTEAAERGWNALRKHNPNVDKSNGSPGGEIVSFSDLSHRQKVNYAVFAAGVLDVKRTFDAVERVPDDVATVSTEGSGDLLKRGRRSGWWWVESADDWVPPEGWEWDPAVHRRYLPLTEVIS